MKYLIGGLFAIVLIIGYFINQSNKADAERLRQAEVAHQQKIQKAKDEINSMAKAQQEKAELDNKIKELQSKLTMDYSEAKRIVESEKLTLADKKYYADITSKWSDAIRVAASTGRISLAQPVKDLQTIRRELDGKQAKGDCEKALKQNLFKAYDYNIDGFINFMQSNEAMSNIYSDLSSDYLKKASILMDYCNQ